MQQTNLDLWLRRKFVYITRVYCNTLPERIPLGMVVEEAPEESGGRYLYKLSTRSENLLRELVSSLETANITYTSRVEDRQVWFTKLLTDPHRSFTFRVVWVIIVFCIAMFLLLGGPQKIWAKLTEEEKPKEEKKEVSDEAKVFKKTDAMYEIDRVK
ncbi:MAG: hypothetical protein KDM63_02130 [Verrucomicrobiae bacterium]|nr:hypothetical protein [Verrucomicrobiae bacterium]MCB1085817.1 hypothetical protein [Verrucomicrobiae bacterium]